MLLPCSNGRERVALLAEGVDRNLCTPSIPQTVLPSPSSRRAWIEIWGCIVDVAKSPTVALLAEGVDRNLGGLIQIDRIG